MKRIIYLIFFLGITHLLYCQNENRIEIGFIENGNIILTYDQEKLKSAFKIEYGDTLVVTNLEIEQENNYYYLVATLQNSNVNYIAAVELDVENQKIFVGAKPTKEEHACYGVGCSGCQFIRDPNGKIVGCHCFIPARDGAYCEHIVKSPGTYYNILIQL